MRSTILEQSNIFRSIFLEWHLPALLQKEKCLFMNYLGGQVNSLLTGVHARDMHFIRGAAWSLFSVALETPKTLLSAILVFTTTAGLEHHYTTVCTAYILYIYFLFFILYVLCTYIYTVFHHISLHHHITRIESFEHRPEHSLGGLPIKEKRIRWNISYCMDLLPFTEPLIHCMSSFL